MFKLGLIINPLAGVGGSVALKGSDGEETARQALALGAEPKAGMRTAQALEVLQGLEFELVTFPAEMGETTARELGFSPRVIGEIVSGNTTAADTLNAARMMVAAGVDLILFAGGDGTARNIIAISANRPIMSITSTRFKLINRHHQIDRHARMTTNAAHFGFFRVFQMPVAEGTIMDFQNFRTEGTDMAAAHHTHCHNRPLIH